MMIKIKTLAKLINFQDYTIKKYYCRPELAKFKKGQYVDSYSFESLIDFFKLKAYSLKNTDKFKMAIEVLNDIKGI